MDALNNILNRVSARELSLPHPTKDEMDLTPTQLRAARRNRQEKKKRFTVIEGGLKDKEDNN